MEKVYGRPEEGLLGLTQRYGALDVCKHTNTDLLNALHLSRDGPASHVGHSPPSFAWDPEEPSSHQEVEKARALGKRIKQ